MEDKKSFLGTGWSFPPTFHNDIKSGVALVSDAEDIRQSLRILMNTRVGERIMQPEYGCDLYAYLFESISNSRAYMIKEVIRTAIVRYEPRINLIQVDLDETDYLDGIIRIHLDYDIPLINTRFNLVFPYYKIEGTDIPFLYRNKKAPLSLGEGNQMKIDN